MNDGIDKERRNDLVRIGIFRGDRALDGELKDSGVLGAGDFVEQILRHTEEGLPSKTVSLDQIIETVLETFGVSPAELMSLKRSLQHVDARNIICQIVCLSGYRGVDIARRLKISGAGVTVAARRGKELVKSHPQLIALVG